MSLLSEVLGKVFKYVYETLHNIGPEPSQISYYAIAVLAMAVLYKLITMPLTFKSASQMAKSSQMQPKMDELKKKYGYDQHIYQQKLQEFQKENNVAQAGCSGCLLTIIQLIIAIALYNVIREPGKYLFSNAGQIDSIARNFFWITDLSKADPTGFLLPLLNSLTQMAVSYFSTMGTPAVTDQAAQIQKIMLYGMPIIFFFIFRGLASGLVLYWVAGNIIEIAVRLILKAFNKKSSTVEVRR